MTRDPYAAEVWAPLLRGGAPLCAVLDTPAAAAQQLATLAEGERFALCGPAGTARQFAALVRRAPVCRIERFSVYPGTGGGFVLLPVAAAAVVRGALPLLPAGRKRWRIARRALHALAPLGLTARLGRPEVLLVTRGTRRALEGALVDEDTDFAIASGVPDSRQKLVARLVDRTGGVARLVKLALRPDAYAAVRREREALARLAPGLGPALLAHGEHDGRPWLAQAALPGRRSGDRLTPAHFALLAALHDAGTAPRVPTFEDELAADLDRHGPELAGDVRSELRALVALARAAPPLRPALVHGDFTPWNLALDGATLRAFDWEDSRPCGPALYDLLHFQVQVGVLVRRTPPDVLLRELLATFSGAGRALVEAAATTREATHTDAVLGALARYLAHVSLRDAVAALRAPAPFVQAGWLREARLALVRSVLALSAEPGAMNRPRRAAA